MKDNPALPGGLSESKPTQGNTLEMFPCVGFFRFRWQRQVTRTGRMPMVNSVSMMAHGTRSARANAGVRDKGRLFQTSRGG
jgi:hypothetical protein